MKLMTEDKCFSSEKLSASARFPVARSLLAGAEKQRGDGGNRRQTSKNYKLLRGATIR